MTPEGWTRVASMCEDVLTDSAWILHDIIVEFESLYNGANKTQKVHHIECSLQVVHSFLYTFQAGSSICLFYSGL